MEKLKKNEMKITSTAFKENEMIPKKYTCDGEDINPPLKIENLPKNSKSLVLIMDDPDAPMGTWVHWVVYNISPDKTEIKEKSVPGHEGINSFKRHTYGGPCPPSGTHRYFFKVYALDKELKVTENSSKMDIEFAMRDSILAEGKLMGLYARAK